MLRPAACLIDIDGTLLAGKAPIPGAPEALSALRREGFPFRLVTNTTRHPRAAIVAELGAAGIAAEVAEIVTPPVAAARWLREQGARRVQLLVPEVGLGEFAGFERDETVPEFVVVGDLGAGFTFERLNAAFRSLLRGARLVALQRSRAWDPGSGLQLDAGPFVAALEFATEKEAILIGKPDPALFRLAAAELNVPAARAAVVGDDLESDIAGARAAGSLAIAVRTGKLSGGDPAMLVRAGIAPDVILDSIAALPDWLFGNRLD